MLYNLRALHAKKHGPNYPHQLLDEWLDSVLRPDELPFTPADLEKMETPTLILHGDRDLFFPLYIPITMYESLPNAELCIWPRQGHFLPDSQPEKLLVPLLEFLGRH